MDRDELEMIEELERMLRDRIRNSENIYLFIEPVEPYICNLAEGMLRLAEEVISGIEKREIKCPVCEGSEFGVDLEDRSIWCHKCLYEKGMEDLIIDGIELKERIKDLSIIEEVTSNELRDMTERYFELEGAVGKAMRVLRGFFERMEEKERELEEERE